MIQSRIYDLMDQEGSPTRPELTVGVVGHHLIPSGISNVTVNLTEVHPGGSFSIHTDNYHHIFYIINGSGQGQLDEDQYELRPGRVIEVPSGVPHGYTNTGNSTMLLLTINIPVS